jgi:hypothetical protein
MRVAVGNACRLRVRLGRGRRHGPVKLLAVTPLDVPASRPSVRGRPRGAGL